jgi:hypothetical protein
VSAQCTLPYGAVKLTPWCRSSLEKLTVFQLAKKQTFRNQKVIIIMIIIIFNNIKA